MLIDFSFRNALIASAAAAGLVVGFLVGKSLYKPIQQESVIVKTEKSASEISHNDGTVTFARNTREITPEIHQKMIPGEIVRVEKFTVIPESKRPVKIEIVQSEEDGGTRITAHADGGTIEGAEDIVIPRMIVMKTEKKPPRSVMILRTLGPRGSEEYGVLGTYEKGRGIVAAGYFFSSQTTFIGVGYRF